MFRFGFKNRVLKIKGKSLLYVFVSIYLVDAFQQLILGTFEGCLARLLQLFYIFLFMEYLYNIYLECNKKQKPFKRLTESYELFGIYNIVCVILCAFLLFIGIISPDDNPVKMNFLIKNDVETLGSNYFFPGHLSIAVSSMRALAQYNIPVLSGLTHEPHVLFYLIGPAFFLLLSRYANKTMIKIFLWLSILMVIFIASAATAIICFAVLLVINQIYNYTRGENKSRSTVLLIALIALSFYVISSGSEILSETGNMLTEKTSTGVMEGSLGFSYCMLYYMFTPHALFGLGNVPGLSGLEVMDSEIGLVSCVLDVVFLVFLYVKAFKLCFSKDIKVHYWGMAVIYFLLHSLKNAYEIFDNQYLAFIFIFVLVATQEGNINQKNKKLSINE